MIDNSDLVRLLKLATKKKPSNLRVVNWYRQLRSTQKWDINTLAALVLITVINIVAVAVLISMGALYGL